MNRAMDKYRVWDEEKKEFVSSRVFINHHGETCVIKHGGFYPHKCTKEHCTGVKDKNGKLIYEGDVVLGSWNTKLIVFWCSVSASFMVKTFDGYEREFHYYSNNRYLPGGGISYCDLEVIGNIHEMEKEK